MVLQDVETDTRVVRVGEASQILSVHPNTLRKWSDKGLIPSYRIGRRRDRRFAVIDLLAFMERPTAAVSKLFGPRPVSR